MTQSASRPTAGILWMILTGLCFVAVTAIVKHLGGEVPAAQSAFLRYVLGLVFLIPMIPAMRRQRLTPRLARLLTLRGLAHTGGVILWFYAMTRITIAEVTAMNYLNPIFVVVGAALFLGEKLACRRIAAIGVALVGAMVILRPGFRELDPGHLAMLGTATFFAVSYFLVKVLSAEVSAAVVVGWLSVSVTIGTAPFAIAVWETPSMTELFWIFGVAVFATAGHYTMTLAFAAAPLTVTQPVVFLQLVWSVLVGAAFFAEPADGWVIFGGALIVTSATFIAWREAVLKRQGVTPHVSETKV